MKAKDIVRFKTPLDEDEKTALMVVLEMRDPRVLVSDLRSKDKSIIPTFVYLVSDLEVVHSAD